MRNKLGILSLSLGALLLLSALLLFLWNQGQARRAGVASQEILPELIQQMEQQQSAEATFSPGETIPDPLDPTMKEIIIDGYAYVGYLSIPALELDLPVMSEWDMERMKIAPCRYFGAVKSDDLVIAGHNYVTHFARLYKLSIGDPVCFTDVDGVVTLYQVYEIETLPPDAVEEMTAGEAALTLFTCTYSGQERVTVRCERVK